MTSQATLFDGVRERATHFGADVLSDAEALEMFLSRAIPDRAHVAAGELLAGYGGDLARILGLSQEALAMRIGSREAAADLKAVHDMTTRLLLAPCRRDVISSWSALNTYVRAKYAGLGREVFNVLFLDKKNQLISDEIMNHGTVDHAPVYPREIVRRALELDASAVILVHNHPSGDPTPSVADIDMTKQVVDACRVLRITVHDHLVVGRDGVASFKSLGLF